MTAEEPGTAEVDEPRVPWLKRQLRLLWRLIVATVGSCLKYRVTGLAAEGAFFAVLSVPPLIFALAGAVGYVSARFTATQIDQVRQSVVEVFSTFLTDTAVNRVIVPTMDEVLAGGDFSVVSLGFVLALWSGSRALNVFVDTISIMYGLGGHRGIVKNRALSFFLYILAMVTGGVTIPLIVAGPTLVQSIIPDEVGFLRSFYWPVVVGVCVCFLATLYHISVPVRTKWRFNLPGATVALLLWLCGSALLRWFLTITAQDSHSVYGPLAAPIAVLIWLYVSAISVLIGAAVNASFDEIFPQQTTTKARRELVARLKHRVAEARERW